MVNPKKREKVRSFITPAIVTSYFTELRKKSMNISEVIHPFGDVVNFDPSSPLQISSSVNLCPL
jgi:hypothetical protein